MNFQNSLKMIRRENFLLILPVNLIFLAILLIFFMLLLGGASHWSIKVPRVFTSDMINRESIRIIITSENVLYYNDRIVTVDDLSSILDHPENRKRSILIKVDRRASVGRIVDVWDLGRNLGFERIDIATDQGG